MNQPDIEIYIKNTNAEEILSWLNAHFENTDLPGFSDAELEKGLLIKGSVNKNLKIPLVVTPKAAGKAFTSIWFQSDQTGWQDDLACAESFVKIHSSEVRCSSATWTEDEEENSEMWWCLKDGDKKLVRWG